MEIGIKKTVNVNVTKLKLDIKVRDRFACSVIDDRGEVVGSYEGYVPNFFPEEHYGDYLTLEIDIETGKITNWNKPTIKDIERLLLPEQEKINPTNNFK